MYTAEVSEARIEDASNVLVAPSALHDDDVVRGFFGSTITPEQLASASPDLAEKTVYLCGDISGISGRQLSAADRVFVVRELSHGYGEGVDAPWTVVGVGRLPLRVHGAGVYYRRFFEVDADHFGRISAEHAFQSLTESTKPGTAHRSGIYLTPVTQDGDALHFRLLRCSTNFAGPTEGFRPADTGIVESLNREAAAVFRNHAPLNHVLAQIYHNTLARTEERMARGREADWAGPKSPSPIREQVDATGVVRDLGRGGPGRGEGVPDSAG